jgi:hypothetical protein
MNTMTLVGDFPMAALGLTFSLGCALLLAFIALRFVVGLVTREQYNVSDAPRRVHAIVWMGHRSNRAGAEPVGSRVPTGGPYLLAAAAPRNRFARNTPRDSGRARRFVQFPQRSGGGDAQSGATGNGHAA